MLTGHILLVSAYQQQGHGFLQCNVEFEIA